MYILIHVYVCTYTQDGILHRRLTCEIVTKVRAWIGTFHANFLVGQVCLCYSACVAVPLV